MIDGIGFIGLGNMGMPMARNFAKAGYQLIVSDIRAESTSAMAEVGALIATAPAQVADQAQLVFVSLPTPEIVKQVVCGPDGILSGGMSKYVVDLSTTGPRMAMRMSEVLKEKGISWIDAPVSGGVGGATAGTLAIMVSGPKSAFAHVKPYLEVIGKVLFIGEKAGLAQTMKLVNNMVSGGALALTAEAMVMGAKAGIDPAMMIQVLNAGSGRNTATVDKFPKSVLTGKFDYGFATALMHKDAKMFMEEAEAMGLSLRTANAVRQLWFETLSELGPCDFTAIAQLMERRAGVELRGHQE